MSHIQTGDYVTIIYVSKKGDVTKRTVKVLTTTSRYMTGYCYMRKQFRTFIWANMLAYEKACHYMEV